MPFREIFAPPPRDDSMDVNSREATIWSDNMRLKSENEHLRATLQGVVSDVLEYEKINNLAPTPGRKYCWDSVERAVLALGQGVDTK